MEMNTVNVRHMPEIQAIAAYLRDMKFKRKAFGGVETEDVLNHISEITLQYEAIVSTGLTLNGQYVRQIVELQERMAQLERDRAAWDQYHTDLLQWYDRANAYLKTQNDRLQGQVTSLRAEANPKRWSEYAPR